MVFCCLFWNFFIGFFSWLSLAFFFDCIYIERLSVFVVLWSYSCMDIHLFLLLKLISHPRLCGSTWYLMS
jgi:hypothetical protein